MTENSLQTFNNDTFKVRTTQDENGEIWFVAKDIAEALEYPKNSLKQVNNLFANVPEIWAGHKPIMVRSENGVEQERDMLCLTEQGVYFFLGRSDKPKALPYQIWGAGEVVPQIRKTGSYSEEPTYVTQASLDKTLWEVSIILDENRELRRKNHELTTELEALKEVLRDDILRPCPFCGGKAALTHGMQPYSWRVVCLSCSVATDEYQDDEKEKAINAWNSRRNDTRTDLNSEDTLKAASKLLEALRDFTAMIEP